MHTVTPSFLSLIFANLTMYGALKLLEAKLLLQEPATPKRSHPPEPAKSP
jgi:hypothetical protein